MNLGKFVEYGTPAILFALVCLNVAQSVLIGLLWGTVKDMKNNMVWSDTCNPKHKETDRRLDKLETKVNGGK